MRRAPRCGTVPRGRDDRLDSEETTAVRSRYEEKFKQGAKAYLEPGEEVLAAFICQPRGRTQARSAGPNLIATAVVHQVGARKLRQAHARAEEAGLAVAAPMVLAVTRRRLLTLRISTPVMGRGGDVQELLSAIPLADVDSIEVRRFGLGKRITVVVRGVAVWLEGAIGANEFLDAFNAAKAGA
jgi:hypothetical protein